jgi:hypothetical protein
MMIITPNTHHLLLRRRFSMLLLLIWHHYLRLWMSCWPIIILYAVVAWSMLLLFYLGFCKVRSDRTHGRFWERLSRILMLLIRRLLELIWRKVRLNGLGLDYTTLWHFLGSIYLLMLFWIIIGVSACCSIIRKLLSF